MAGGAGLYVDTQAMTFFSSYDIANRALQHVGSPRISTFADNSKAAQECGFIYDKVRRAELRRHIWRFSTRRTALRAITGTSQNLVFGAYASGTTYAAGDVVSAANLANTGSDLWISLQGSNTGNAPNASPLFWQEYFGPVVADTYSASATYYAGEIVKQSTTFYLSLINSNLNNSPSSSASDWLSLTSQPTGSTVFLPNPIVANQQNAARTAFRLPNGFLRIAAQDPRAAGVNYLATSGGMQFSDFEIEGNYLITATASPVIFRFAADLEDVSQFDDLFCEGLAARMAVGLCETLTQNPQKKQQVTQDYDRFMSEARQINAIEVGSTEPLEEGFLVSRQSDANAPTMQAPQRGQQ